jgi:hypothetical protein
MKSHHAAVLALVGWYLMVPPAHTANGKVFVDSRYSMRYWTRVVRTFDSATDCEEAREKTKKNVQDAEERMLESAAENDANPRGQDIEAYEVGRQMKCVSKDDPRIKGMHPSINPAWSSFVPAK